MRPLPTALLLTFCTSIAAPAAAAQHELRLLLLGYVTPRAIDIRGVEGRLALDPLIPCPAGLGNDVTTQLRTLRAIRELAPLREIHFQTLSQAPDNGRLRLSAVMRLPFGTDAEMTTVAPLRQAKDDPSEISYPTVKTLEITLQEEPIHTLWTRHLSFTNWQGSVKRVPIAFTRKVGLTWRGTIDAAGLATLQSLADTGNRSHWDDMKLENRGGTTELKIARVKIVLHYDKSSAYATDIPIVDAAMNQTLAAGNSAIDLDAYARLSRRAWSGVTGSDHLVVRLATDDFGKSGSDGSDGFGANPKFGGQDYELCSEFVSWYYHQAGLQIGSEDFRDIVVTGQIDAAFQAAGRRYDYNNYHREWRIAGGTAKYTPQPGDFLARRFGGDYEHSMIVMSWNDTLKTMLVINGPWPVTLRLVKIQEMEEDGFDFRVGKIR